jgi:ribbon-helix-helix CopG family protein
MRTIIDLPAAHLEALDALCQHEHISRAEAVRRAVDQYVRQQRAGDAGRAFGLWRRRGVDGLTYEKRLRREWDVPVKPRATSR